MCKYKEGSEDKNGKQGIKVKWPEISKGGQIEG